MASQANLAKKLINKLKHERTKYMNTRLNIIFNKTCKKKGLIPSYIQIHTNSKSIAAQTALKQARKSWLDKEIKELYKKSAEVKCNLISISTQLNSLLTKSEYRKVNNKIVNAVNKKRLSKQRTMSKKLTCLTEAQKKPYLQSKEQHTFYPRVVNLTNISFNEEESGIIGKSSKYNLPADEKHSNDLKNLIIETEVALSFIDKEKQDKVRYEAANKIEKFISKSQRRRLRKKRFSKNEKSCINNVKDKLGENNARLVEADKSNATVVISESTLGDKVNDFFQKNGVFEINDKTADYNKSIKDIINNNCVIHPQKRKQLYNSKAAPPKFKPLVKTHKDDMPIRPVINCIQAPAYKLSKYLASLIKSRIDLTSNYTCQNSKEFIDSLHSHSLDKNNILLSIDVDNMYANIPPNEAIDALVVRLHESDKFSNAEIEDIKLMVGEITRQNYFEWGNKTYCDPKGLPMGGPLSALLAEIYLQQFENSKIMNPTNPHFSKIQFYQRYVDDSFMIFKGTKRQANVFLSYLNSIHNTIKFKIEIEDNNSIAFLDVRIKRTCDGFEFGIHRKPTQTDLVIPIDSNHPYQYKLSAFRSMVFRLLTYRLCTKEYEKEKSIIKRIAYNNGYDPSLIDNLIRKTKFKLANPNQKDTTKKKFVPLNYINQHSEIVGNIFKKNGFHPGYKVNKTVFRKPSTPTDKKHAKGVYLIDCNGGESCGKKYIGYTNRSFGERFKEHNAVNQNNPSSKVAQHLKENKDHKIDFDRSLKVLKHCSNRNKAQVWEELFIYQNVVTNGKDSLLNKKEEFADKITYQLFSQLDNKN